MLPMDRPVDHLLDKHCHGLFLLYYEHGLAPNHAQEGSVPSCAALINPLQNKFRWKQPGRFQC